jgi:GPH family glycoside/pentoside/hexuronide:cation symporter
MLENNAETNISVSRKRELSAKRLFGDGIGMFGINILIIGFFSILSYYYTDVAGISAGLVGTLILISRFLDGFTDIVMGNLIDKTKSKHGKARPWLLWLGVPAALSGIALFYVPEMGQIGQTVYIIATNALFFSVVVTGLQVAYSSLMALSTKNSYDRSVMGIVRGIFGFAAGLIMSVAFIPVVTSMGNDQTSWTLLISIFSAIAAITIYISFRSTKEIVSKDKVEQESGIAFKVKFRALFRNKYMLLVLVANIFASAIAALNASAGIYYAQYIWQNINLVALIGAIGLLPMLIGFALIAPLVKRMGKRNVVIAGSVITIVGSLIRLIDPYSVPFGVAGLFVAGLGMVPTMTLMFAMLSDSIEYGEWKTGMRMEGLVNGSMNFVNKVGNGLGVGGIGWLLGLGGYVAGHATQSELANQMIIAINIYIPILLSIAIIAILSVYKLDKEYSQIVSDLEARR